MVALSSSSHPRPQNGLLEAKVHGMAGGAGVPCGCCFKRCGPPGNEVSDG